MGGPSLRSCAVVGRAGELTALAAGVDGARAGHGSTVVLTGEPGVGKSRLLRAVHGHCRRAGAATLIGRAVDTATPAPFRPLTEALLGTPAEPGATTALVRTLALAGRVEDDQARRAGLQVRVDVRRAGLQLKPGAEMAFGRGRVGRRNGAPVTWLHRRQPATGEQRRSGR